MSLWRAQQRRLDAFVDKHFAEPVEFHPWTVSDSSSPTESGERDHTREILTTEGVYVSVGASIIGEAGMAHAFGGQTQQIAQDTWVSVTEDNMKGTFGTWKEYDRVYFPERNELWTIAYPASSATGRPDYHLIRAQSADLADFLATRDVTEESL